MVSPWDMEHVRTACMIWKQVGILYLKNSKTFDPKTAGLQDEKDGSKTPFGIIPPVDAGNTDPVLASHVSSNIHLALRSMASAKFLSHQSSPIHIPGARTSTANIQAPACARETHCKSLARRRLSWPARNLSQLQPPESAGVHMGFNLKKSFGKD